MRKLFTFLLGAAFLLFGGIQVQAQTYYDDYVVDEDFDSNDLGTWGFVSSGSGLVFSNTASYLNLLIQNPTGTATKTFETAIQKGEDGKVYFDFDWYLGAPTRATSACTFYIRDTDGKNIFGAGAIYSSNNGFRVINNGLSSGATAITDQSTQVGTFSFNITLNIKLAIDFEAKTLSMTATNIANASATMTLNDLPFLDNTATDVADLYLDWFRSGAGNGNYQFDNFKIYTKKESAGVADVTINYLNGVGGNIIKSSRIAEGQELGSSYGLLASDKESFTESGIYYAYNAALTGAESVVVAEGAKIDVIFKGTAVTAGTYVWTGEASTSWNDFDANFSVDGGSAIGYQDGNAVVFDATGSNKDVVVVGTLNIDAANVTIDAEEYTFSGIGKLTGTGSLLVNASSVLDIVNELSGGVEINAGTLEVRNDAAGVLYSVADGTGLNVNSGEAFSKAITGAGSFTLTPTSNVTYTSAITGISELNYNLLTKGSAAASGGNFSGMPTLDNTFAGQINVSTTTGEEVWFGTTVNNANAKLSLGDDVTLVFTKNPSSPTSDLTLGELSGTSASKIMGPRLRGVNYSIGGLNTDFTFAGTIENFPEDTWSNVPNIFFIKEGTGTFTLSGANAEYVSGSVAVNAGSLEVTGSLGGADVPVTVAVGATLKGSGSIAGATTVNGTLDATEGSLSFGGNLTLAGTTNFEVVSSPLRAAGDAISVTGDLTKGGVLVITWDEEPASTTSIPVFTVAGTTSGDFTSVSLPVAEDGTVTFDAETGMLTYTRTEVGIDANDAQKEVLSVKYYDLTGKELSEDVQGFVIKKTTYVDGSVSNEKILKK